MKLLKGLVTFIAGTILGAIGQKVMGLYGMLLGSVAGAVVGWWAAKRMFQDF
jgi:hypothetical protein